MFNLVTSHKNHGRNFKKVILVFATMASVFLLASCREDNPDSCKQPFTKTLALTIDNNNHLTLSVSQLDFLNDPKLVLSDIQLNVTVKGKKKPTKELTLSLNGLKISRHDGYNLAEDDDDDYRKSSDTKARFKLHKMKLNGSESFEIFILKLRKNKGVLDVNIAKHDSKVIEASITFTGSKYITCPNPPPPPPPPPADVHTKINSVTPSVSPTASTDIVFVMTSDLAGSKMYCSLDGVPATQCASPKSYSGLVSGAHIFKVYSVGPQGQIEKQPVSYSWVVDAIAPSVTITNLSSLPVLTKSNSISFTLASNEPNASFICSLDEEAGVPCTSPVSYTSLAQGLHKFSVTAADSLGNVNTVPATFQWTVDLTAPLATIINIVPAGAINNTSAKEFTFIANEAAYFQCSVDASAFSTCVSPVAVNGLSDGTHWFEVRAIDLAGNQGLSSSFSWKVDTVAPVLTLGAVSPAQGLTNANNISVEFSSDEIATHFCSFNGAAALECQSPFVATNLSQGNQSLSLYSLDSAGNKSTVLNLSWVVDLTAPVISFGQILPSSASVISSKNIELPVNSSKASALIVELNGQLQGQTASPIHFENLTEDFYVVSVKAKDSAGNISNIITHSFTVDVTAPTISLTATNLSNPSNQDHNSFEFASSETSVFYCNVDGMGFEICSSPKVLSGLADGNHSIVLKAVDLAGNSSSESAYSWAIDTTAPETSVLGNQVANNNITFTLSANEANVTFVCSLDGAVFAACTSPVSYSSVAGGTHSFVAKAIDHAGNIDSAGATYQFTVLDPVKAIITSVSPSKSPTNQNQMTIAFTSDRGPATFICSMDNQAATPCTSPITYTAIPDGSHSFIVRAVDEFNNIDAIGAAINWSVDTVKPLLLSFTTSTASTSITVSWVTNELTTGKVLYGQGSTINQSTVETTTLATDHTVQLNGLLPSTSYSIVITGRDGAGNTYISPIFTTITNGLSL